MCSLRSGEWVSISYCWKGLYDDEDEGGDSIDGETKKSIKNSESKFDESYGMDKIELVLGEVSTIGPEIIDEVNGVKQEILDLERKFNHIESKLEAGKQEEILSESFLFNQLFSLQKSKRKLLDLLGKLEEVITETINSGFNQGEFFEDMVSKRDSLREVLQQINNLSSSLEKAKKDLSSEGV